MAQSSSERAVEAGVAMSDEIQNTSRLVRVGLVLLIIYATVCAIGNSATIQGTWKSALNTAALDAFYVGLLIYLLRGLRKLK